MTLYRAALDYLIYLHALGMEPHLIRRRAAVLKDICAFYSFHFPLHLFKGEEVLRYANEYDPWDFVPVFREKANTYWHFVYWMKKNEMIPGWKRARTR